MSLPETGAALQVAGALEWPDQGRKGWWVMDELTAYIARQFAHLGPETVTLVQEFARDVADRREPKPLGWMLNAQAGATLDYVLGRAWALRAPPYSEEESRQRRQLVRF